MIRFFWYFQMTDLIGAALVKRRRPQLVRRPFDSEAVVPALTAVGEAACVSGYLGQAIYCNRTVGLPTVAISTPANASTGSKTRSDSIAAIRS